MTEWAHEIGGAVTVWRGIFDSGAPAAIVSPLHARVLVIVRGYLGGGSFRARSGSIVLARPGSPRDDVTARRRTDVVEVSLSSVAFREIAEYWPDEPLLVMHAPVAGDAADRLIRYGTKETPEAALPFQAALYEVIASARRRGSSVRPPADRAEARARRLERAAVEIASTDEPISLIAERAGFADHSHLTREFARATGTTPRRFREQIREDLP